MAGRVYSDVIRGRLTVARPRRTHCEVKVYAGTTENSELVEEWEMPKELNSALSLAASQAELQTKRKRFTVTARPENRWYAIEIEGLPPNMAGATQSNLNEGRAGVESMAREVVALLLEVDEKSFDLDITIEGDSK